MYWKFPRVPQIFCLFLQCLLVLLLFLFQANTAQSEEPDTRKKVAERYWEILVRSPRKGVALDKLYEIYSDSGRSELLLQRTQMALSDTRSDSVRSQRYVLLGLLHQKRREIADSIDSFRNALQLDPSNGPAAFYLSEQLALSGHFAEAVDLLKKALKQNSTRGERRMILLTMGECAFQTGDTALLEETHKGLLQLDPGDCELSTRIISLMIDNGRWEEALKEYQTCLSNSSLREEDRTRLTLDQARLEILLNRIPQAQDTCQTLLDRLDPDSPQATALRDRINELFLEQENGRIHLVDFYRRRLAKNPLEQASRLQLAEQLFRLHRKEESLQLLYAGLQRQSDAVVQRIQLADYLARSGRFSEAVEQYALLDSVAPLEETDGSLLLKWVDALGQTVRSKEPEQKIQMAELLTRYVRHSGETAEVLAETSKKAMKYGLTESAENYARKWVELDPDNFSARENLIRYYLSVGQKDHALSATGFELDQKHVSTKTLLQAEALYRASGWVEEADRCLSRAAEQEPLGNELQWNYLKILLQKEEFGKAAEILSRMERNCLSDKQYREFLHKRQALIQDGLEMPLNDNEEPHPWETAARFYWRQAAQWENQGRISDAVDTVELALSSGPPSIPLQQWALNLFDQAGRTDRVVQLCEQITRVGAVENPDDWKQLILKWEQAEKPEATLEAVQKLYELAGHETNSAYFCAERFAHAGRQDEALMILRKILIQSPRHHNTLKLLVEIYVQKHDESQAVEPAKRLFEEAETLEKRKQYLQTLLRCYKKSGRTEEGIVLLKQSPGSMKDRLLYQVWAHSAMGNLDLARKVLDGIPVGSGGREADLFLQREKVDLYEKQGDFEAAIPVQEQICRSTRKEEDYDRLFLLNDKNGNRDQARALFLSRILLKSDLEGQLQLIDRMFGRGEYDALSRILDFLEIHSPPDWRCDYRQIVLAAYKNREELLDRVLEFRENPADESAFEFTPQPQSPWQLKGFVPSGDQEIRSFIIENYRSDSNQSLDRLEEALRRLFPTIRHMQSFLPTLYPELLELKTFTTDDPKERPSWFSTDGKEPLKPFHVPATLHEVRWTALLWYAKNVLESPHESDALNRLRHSLPWEKSDQTIREERLLLEAALCDMLRLSNRNISP